MKKAEIKDLAVTKLAEVFAGAKSLKNIRYFDDELYKRATTWRYSAETTKIERPMYNQAIFSLFEYLGAGINKNKKASEHFLRIIGTGKDIEDVINRLSLMRVRQTLAINPIHNAMDRQFYTCVKQPLDALAQEMAVAIYEKLALYHYMSKNADRHAKPKSATVSPKALVAATILYPYLEGWEAAIRNTQSGFDICLLISSKYYQSMIQDHGILEAIEKANETNQNTNKLFNQIVILFNRALIEGKTKCAKE